MLPSITATHELVVPRSIPTTSEPVLRGADRSRFAKEASGKQHQCRIPNRQADGDLAVLPVLVHATSLRSRFVFRSIHMLLSAAKQDKNAPKHAYAHSELAIKGTERA